MKDVILVGALCVAALVTGILLYMYGPTLLSQESGGPVSFSSVASGARAAEVTAQKNYRITSREDLSILWAMIHGNDAPRIPSVDFETQEVLAVFDGTHSSGGYSIKVARVVDQSLTRIVYVEQHRPAENCSVPSVLTSPYELVVVPKLPDTRTMTHVDTVVTNECS